MTSTLVLQQQVKLNGETLSVGDFEDAADQAIQEMYNTGDDSKMFGIISTLSSLEHVLLFTKSKILAHYKVWWDEQGRDENEFYLRYDFVASKQVLKNYITLWGKYFTNEIPEWLKERPLKLQIPVAKALDAGYEITDEHWETMKGCLTDTELHRVLQEDVKGKTFGLGSYIPKLLPDGTIIVEHLGYEIPYGKVNLPDGVDIKELSKGLDNPDLSETDKFYIISQRVFAKMELRLRQLNIQLEEK